MYTFQRMALYDLKFYDWVMYKFLLGSMEKTLIRETFQTASEEPLRDELLNKPIFLFNALAAAWDNTKTLCKYFFPANQIATNLPHKELVFVEVCKRNHVDVYHRAMMGPQVICAHAELEWCLPFETLDTVLDALEKCAHTSTNPFFKQPIECSLFTA